MGEEWRDVIGWEGLYQVSNHGRVRSLDRHYTQRVRGGHIRPRFIAGKILAAGRDNKGYPMTAFCREGKVTRLAVHHLVLEAFHTLRPKGKVADHINGIRHDNRIENLRWVSYRSNARNRHSPRYGNPHVGVDYRAKRASPWRAKSTDKHGRAVHIGYFKTPEAATNAYLNFKARNFEDA